MKEMHGDRKAGLIKKTLESPVLGLQSCKLCPRECAVNREISKGFCGQKVVPRISSAVLHFGEEPPLVGRGGSGTVFFCGCSMKCVYCQNFMISQKNNGADISVEELSEIFLRLQREGAENINLVTPAAHLPGILAGLGLAVNSGLSIPIVYNTSGYERAEIIRLLDGIIDVYLADIRYTDDTNGLKYSGTSDYWTVTQKAIKEMYRQVGAFSENRYDTPKGLILRHLVLPQGISGTDAMGEFVAYEMSSSVPISLMSQYRPVFHARDYPEISRRITDREYEDALSLIDHYGLTGWYQHFSGNESHRVRPLGRKE